MAAFFFECKFCSWAWIAFVFLNRPKGPDLSEHYKNRTNRNCGKPYVPSSHSPLFLAKLLIGLTLFDTSARYILAFCTVAQLTCNEESSWSQRGGVFFFPPAIFGKKNRSNLLRQRRSRKFTGPKSVGHFPHEPKCHRLGKMFGPPECLEVTYPWRRNSWLPAARPTSPESPSCGRRIRWWRPGATLSSYLEDGLPGLVSS